jgi:hypothetical protein
MDKIGTKIAPVSSNTDETTTCQAPLILAMEGHRLTQPHLESGGFKNLPIDVHRSHTIDKKHGPIDIRSDFTELKHQGANIN